MKRLVCVLLLPMLTAGSLAAQTAVSSEPLPELALTPCPDDAVAPPLAGQEVLCGTLEVYENRRAQSGRKIGLHVMVRPASVEATRPPVFWLAGGPGVPATLEGAAFSQLSAAILQHRDLVLVDVRGIGRSNGLECEPSGPKNRVQSFLYYLLPHAEAKRCVEALAERADLTQYTTSYAADDLDDVRRALGYEKLALAGASYGTRLGLEILRRHADKVELAMLLGVAPPGMAAPMGFARSLEVTKDEMLRACAADETCRTAYPNFAENLAKVLARAAAGPVSATVTNPQTGENEEVTLEYGDFVMGVRFVLYSAEGAAEFPARIESAVAGDFAPLLQDIAVRVGGIRQVLSYGLFYSMRCAEDLPFVDLEKERQDAAGTMLGTFRIDRELLNCTVWPRAEIDPTFRQPVTANVPVLLLSGSEDPVTPPIHADVVARTLPRSVHVVFANRAHGFFDPEALGCLVPMLDTFFERSSVDGLDVSCAERLKRLPFEVVVAEPKDPEGEAK